MNLFCYKIRSFSIVLSINPLCICLIPFTMPFNSDAELLLFLEDNISLLTFSSILFVLLKKFSLYSFPLFFSSRILSYEGKYSYVHTAPIFE